MEGYEERISYSDNRATAIGVGEAGAKISSPITTINGTAIIDGMLTVNGSINNPMINSHEGRIANMESKMSRVEGAIGISSYSSNGKIQEQEYLIRDLMRRIIILEDNVRRLSSGK